MELNYFDIIIGSIVLILGIKGILNGLFKELFGLVGIVGGLFVASRYSHEVGMYLNDMVFHFDNTASINFTGFLITLIVFWGGMVIVGIAFKKLVSASGFGIFDRILGFIFGASKFFLIMSIIVYAAYNVKSIRENIEKPMASSILFPVMVQTGGFIMNMDTNELVASLKEKQKELQAQVSHTIENVTKKEVEKKVEEVKEEVKQQVQEKTQEVKEKVQEKAQEVKEETQEAKEEPQEKAAEEEVKKEEASNSEENAHQKEQTQEEHQE